MATSLQVWRLLIVILGVCVAMFLAREGMPPTPTLTVQPGSGEVTLEWCGLDDEKEDEFSFEYQLRSAEAAYPDDEWTEMQGAERQHVVRDLENGHVYLFHVRAVRKRGAIRGRPSNEVSVVPFGLSERSEARLDALNARVNVLDVADSCRTLGNVWFDHDSASVLPIPDADLANENEERLKTIISGLGDMGNDRVVVVKGYASTVGRASHNLDLSESRALAVVEYLARRVPSGKFFAIAEGERRDWMGGRQANQGREAVVALCRLPID